jgi:phosphatidylserine/phosphatidylglycerophosphate/cardiolipin synthase-like enzyme
MQVQAHFSGIQQAIARQLESATQSVRVFADLFSDRDLFEALLSCQRRGVAVSLIITDCEVNRQSSIAWERLSALGGRIVRLPAASVSGDEFDRSFCLIDDTSVISGDFKWTSVQDAGTQVSILIQCDTEISEHFMRTFARMLDEPWQFGSQGAVESEEPSAANLQQGQGLSLYQDPQLDELRLRVRMMEARILAVETEIADIHRQIHLFDHQQEQAIGDLMRRYLDLKRRYLQAMFRESREELQRQQAQAAEAVYRQYQEARSARSTETAPEELDPQQQRELKQLYRKLAMQCHPDRVRDEDKVQAKVFFQQLQLTFQNSDLTRLKQLKVRIDAGLGVKADLVLPDQRHQLELHLKELQQALFQRNQQLASVSQSSSWRELSARGNWSTWFEQQAKRLKAAMQHYMTELDQLAPELRV